MEKKEYSYDIGIRPKKWEIPKNFKYYRTSIGFKTLRFIIMLIPVITYYFYLKIRYNIKFKNRKKALKIIKENGAVLICNHILPSDASSIIISFFPKVIYTPMLKSNMGFFIISKIFRLAGCIPIPDTLSETKKFEYETKNALNENNTILFMAEGSLELFCNHIRPFSKGPFKFAYDTNKTIIPICITTNEKKHGKSPCLCVNFLDEYKIIKTSNKRLDIEKITCNVYEIMNDFFINNSNYKTTQNKN